MTFEGEQGLWLVQCKNTNIIVISTRGNKTTRICVIGPDDTNAGYKIVVSRHTVHLCEASIGAVKNKECISYS